MRGFIRWSLLAVGLSAGALPATANILVGQAAPNFTKTKLGGGALSLNDYAGKVVVLFLLGYD